MDDSSVKSRGDRIYQVIITLILIIFALCAILPFILLLSSSLTDEATLLKEGYAFIPRKFSAYAYEYLFSSNGAKIFKSYGITLIVTAIGTCLSLLVGPMLAWVLSRREYKRAKLFTFMVLFTMLFNGGIVPSYIMWSQYFHIKNTIWALIFPTLLFNGFYIILYKNNFASNIHPALVEAAKIDGAGELYIYFKVVLPLSLPILATIGLMVGLGYWNDWTNGMYYISSSKMLSVQALLNRMIQDIQALAANSSADSGALMRIPQVSIRMAIAFVAILPVLMVYPFLQKYFASGIMLGAVKG